MSEDEELREARSWGKRGKEGLVKMSVEDEKNIFHDEKRENKCLCQSFMTGYN